MNKSASSVAARLEHIDKGVGDRHALDGRAKPIDRNLADLSIRVWSSPAHIVSARADDSCRRLEPLFGVPLLSDQERRYYSRGS